ncbi:hypothetical protein [Pseudaminobacter soli (ex Zhang et al. 2022)]|nr:hypothetical protein [Pseudaminobacter soli]
MGNRMLLLATALAVIFIAALAIAPSLIRTQNGPGDPPPHPFQTD